MTKEQLARGAELYDILCNEEFRLNEMRKESSKGVYISGEHIRVQISGLPCFKDIMKMVETDLEAKVIELREQFEKV